jgi:hypothetical protein
MSNKISDILETVYFVIDATLVYNHIAASIAILLPFSEDIFISLNALGLFSFAILFMFLIPILFGLNKELYQLNFKK